MHGPRQYGPQVAETGRRQAGKGSLRAQMLRSHLLVASIALSMTLMVLGFAFHLSSQSRRLTTDFVSKVEASQRIQRGVQQSFAGLRGWMTLKDERFLKERLSAWNDHIAPAVEILKEKLGNSGWTWEGASLAQFLTLLEDLRESQWWVQDIAQSPGNEPARTTYQSEVVPVAEGILSGIAFLIAEEDELAGGNSRKRLLGRFGALQNALTQAMLMLEKFIVANDSGDKEAFQDRLVDFGKLIAEIETQGEFLTREQAVFLNTVKNDLPVLTRLTAKAVQLRESPRSNVAQWLLSTETILIAGKVVTVSDAISRTARDAMWAEVEANDRLGEAGILIFLLFTAGTVAIVFVISKRRANYLAEPVMRLSEAAQEVAEGRLDKGVTVDRDDELGRLADNFNKMRLSVQEAKNALIAANTSLERRVEERTASIGQMNRDLENEVEKRGRTQRKLKSYAVELERSNRELQDFAQVASHDLQEPLRKVQAFGDRLKGKFGDRLGDEGRDYVARMQDASGRMSDLIRDLLSFSRVTSKAKSFVRVDLAEVMRGVLSDLEVRIQETGARVEVDDFPTIDADPGQMRQLLQNLVGNALKFRREGNPPVVKVRCNGPEDGQEGPNAANGVCRISIEDNGIGFDPQHADRIFTIFERLHGRNDYQGTGIGLAVCRKIVERHHGTISAAGVPEKGSTFTVILPTEHTQEDDEQEDDES